MRGKHNTMDKPIIELNAGNLWTDEYLDKVIELNSSHEHVKVRSLFGSITQLTPTARAFDRLPYRDWAFLDRYIDRCNKHGIAVRYTLNHSCVGAIQDFKRDWEAKLRADVKELHNIGVHEWTITSPLILMQVRDMFPDDFIEVSTIAELASPNDALLWMSIGADAVCISTSINRDFTAIKSIASTGMRVSVLANEACLYRCPYRRECYNLSSHNSQRSEELFGFYPFSACNNWRMEFPVEWTKARLVLPQWMRLYQEKTGVSNFKVAYRTHPYEVAVPMLELYMNELHTGNLLDLWPTISRLGNTSEPKDMLNISCERLDENKFIEHFVSQGQHCVRKQCGIDCMYCLDMLEKTIVH